MTKKTTIQSIDIDKNFVNSLIVAHGPVPAMDMIRKCFGENMISSISDDKLRIMLWQTNHSLNALRNATDEHCHDISTIEHIIDTTESKTTLSVSHHVIEALDSIIEYVTE